MIAGIINILHHGVQYGEKFKVNLMQICYFKCWLCYTKSILSLCKTSSWNVWEPKFCRIAEFILSDYVYPPERGREIGG